MAKKGNDFKSQPTKLQKPVLNFLRSNEISVITGMAGTGKDFICMYRALEGLFYKEFEEIVLIKPIVEMGKSVGFLPGSEKDKYEPYIQSFIENIKKITNKGFFEKYRSKIKFEPTSFLRGNTIEHSAVILSEAQNLTLHELISVVTRVAGSSKLFINGDLQQSDIGRKSGLKDFLKIIENLEGVNHVELGEEFQMRSKLIVDITKEYNKFLEG